MAGIIVSYVVMFTASPHDSQNMWGSVADFTAILLIVAMFVTAFGADALIIRLSLYGWAEVDGRARVFAIVWRCLLIVGAEVLCSFGTGAIFFAGELASSCQRFGC